MKALKESLHKAGYHIKSNATKAEMVPAQQRVDCGHMCYHAISVDELQTFARDRHVVLKDSKRWTIMKALISADYKRTFEGFMDLPPELRNVVYAFYLAAFDQTLQTPAPPPLTFVSKAVAKEVLPMFYSGKTFAITFLRLDYDEGHGGKFRPTDATQHFLLRLTRESIADIRSLDVHVGTTYEKYRGDFKDWVFCRCSIELDGFAAGYRLRIEGSEGDGFDEGERVERRRKKLQEQMEKVLDRVAEREGTKKFRIEDIYALRTAMEITYR